MHMLNPSLRHSVNQEVCSGFLDRPVDTARPVAIKVEAKSKNSKKTRHMWVRKLTLSTSTALVQNPTNGWKSGSTALVQDNFYPILVYYGTGRGAGSLVLKWNPPSTESFIYDGSSTFITDPAKNVCTQCPPGSFQSASGQNSCELCPAGSYSAEPGAAECTPCGDGAIPADDLLEHFTSLTGLASNEACVCADGWTGTNCDVFECPKTLPFISLSLLLIEASYPEELRERGSRLSREQTQWTTAYRVNTILRMADADG